MSSLLPPAQSTHEPLDRDRHAGLVVHLMHNHTKIWRLLYRPPVYMFDERDADRGCDLSLRAEQLRNAFERCTVWEHALEILVELKAIDQEACPMSIGTIEDYGESPGECIANCDCPGRIR